MENEMKELQDQKEQILAEAEAFAKAEYEVVRLQVVKNISHVVGSLLLTICLILVVFAVLAFCAAAAVLALSQCVPAWAACLIVGAFYFLLIPVLFACYKALFINPIVRKLTGLKDCEELKFETLRAEGKAAVQRERVYSYVRFVKVIYSHYSQLAQTVRNLIRNLFSKKQ